MGWAKLIRDAMRSAVEDQLLDWAAALSFYFLFALFPAILLLAALLSTFHLESLTTNLVAALSRNLPDQAAVLVSRQLRDLLQHHVPGLISLDLILLFYSASRGFAGLMTALNAAYEVAETRPYWRQMLISLGLTLSAGVLIALALAILLLGGRVLTIIAGPISMGFTLSLFWPLIRWAATLGCMAFAVMMLYRFAPNVRRRARGILPAVVSAMALWVIASALLAAYINNFATYSVVYGSLGAVIALMLWFYVFALAILLGAEIHNAWLKRRGLGSELRRAA